MFVRVMGVFLISLLLKQIHICNKALIHKLQSQWSCCQDSYKSWLLFKFHYLLTQILKEEDQDCSRKEFSCIRNRGRILVLIHAYRLKWYKESHERQVQDLIFLLQSTFWSIKAVGLSLLLLSKTWFKQSEQQPYHSFKLWYQHYNSN